MGLPADNKGVDKDGLWLQAVRTYLKSLEPASTLSEAQVTALKALLNVQEETEADPPSQGSIPYQGLSEATTLALGEPGQFLGVNDEGTAPEWQDGGSFEYPAVETAFALATTHTVVLTKAYKAIEVIVNDTTHGGAATGQLAIELSDDGGNNWTSPQAIASNTAAASDVIEGVATVENCADLSVTRLVHSTMSTNAVTGIIVFAVSGVSGSINALRFSWISSGTARLFATGTFTLKASL